MDTAAFLAGIVGQAPYGVPAISRLDDGIPYVHGQFWTARQRQAHSIHELSYRGCFKAELPAFFIAGLSEPGDCVYDPFCGRGTTLVQAALMGRTPAGCDINPLAAMLCRPRLRTPDLEAVAARLAAIDWHPATLPADPLPDADLLTFYHPATLAQLRALRAHLLAADATRALDPVDDWIRMVALNRLTGHSAGYFSVYTLPPNQAASVASQRRINAKRLQQPPERDVAAIILKKTRTLLRSGHVASSSSSMPVTGAAWATPTIPDASVALVVTSPPFLDVIRYDLDNWLRCWFAGIALSAVAISQIKGEAEWQRMIRDTLVELARVVRLGGHIAFEVGEVRQGTVRLERLVWAAAEGLPFERICVLVHGGAFTKTAHIWRVANNVSGTNTNRIVLLRRW